jgi:predicted CxxxxCH...CXXCH cytochrome family protein
MGKIINRKQRGMSWWMKTGFVLILTLAMSVLSYQGWYNPGIAGAVTGTVSLCGDCHGHPAGPTALTDSATRTSTAFQGSHVKHVANAASCATCHTNPTLLDHSDGVINVNASISGGTYSGGTAVAVNTTVSRASTTYGTCSGTSCHAAVYSTTVGVSPNWTAAGGGCGACHKTEGTSLGTFQASGVGIGAPATGGHNMHIPQATGGCADCHTGATSASYTAATHGNGQIDVSTGYNGGVAPAKRTAGGTYYTCTAASCHANPYAAGTATTGVWGTGTGGCAACHNGAGAFISYSASVQGNVATPQQSGPNTGSHSGHINYGRYVCAECHAGALTGSSGGNKHGNTFINVTGANGAYVAGGIAKHAIGTYSATGCAAACHKGVGGTANPIWGSLVLKCIECHAATILRTKGRPGKMLANAVGEFTLAWGHKKTARGAVTDSDCIVCHLEGNFTTQKTSQYHADGNIDLRAPDGAGETPINKVSAATAFTFQRFSTSYAATSRTATGHTLDSIDNVITIKFCMACHDSTGATNPTARTKNTAGTVTGTAAMPFGGVALGATYTALNKAIGTQGLIDVSSQFLSTNSSKHPVGAPNSRAYPYSNRLIAPYNNIGATRDANTTAANTASPRVKADSVVLYCNDCHTTSTALTLRTITAHGNAATLRGTIFVASPTLCLSCHGNAVAYTTSSQHGAGSAFTTGNNNIGSNTTTCNNCHFSNLADPGRPVRGFDVHGFNGLLATGGAWTYGNGNGIRPIAFMRNTTRWTTTSPRPYVATVAGPGQFALAAGASNCGGSASLGTGCSNQNHNAYSPGGSY